MWLDAIALMQQMMGRLVICLLSSFFIWTKALLHASKVFQDF